ncbi:MAG: hypothetical protein HY705_00385 [Gemmatimonadetes bacterium]|nr:hypothetical protein [Gemmatimonadota bacterium]
MSPGKVFFAFVAVAALFILLGPLSGGRKLNRAAVMVLSAEALVLTLFSALWFGSLGHGGWPLVFLLVGALVSGAERGLRFAFLRAAVRGELKMLGLGVGKYLLAGALLAWRLG